jgi:hypothetical protein
MSDLIQDEAQHLVKDLKAASGAPFNPQSLIRKSVANIISVILFGERFQYDDPRFVEKLQEMSEVTEIVGANNPAMLFKALRYIPGDPFKFHKVGVFCIRRRYIYFCKICRHSIVFIISSSTAVFKINVKSELGEEIIIMQSF